MMGYHDSDGYRIEPLDDRDEEDPEYEIDPEFSCTNTDFGGDDPAKEDIAAEPTFDPRPTTRP